MSVTAMLLAIGLVAGWLLRGWWEGRRPRF